MQCNGQKIWIAGGGGGDCGSQTGNSQVLYHRSWGHVNETYEINSVL